MVHDITASGLVASADACYAPLPPLCLTLFWLRFAQSLSPAVAPSEPCSPAPGRLLSSPAPASPSGAAAACLRGGVPSAASLLRPSPPVSLVSLSLSGTPSCVVGHPLLLLQLHHCFGCYWAPGCCGLPNPVVHRLLAHCEQLPPVSLQALELACGQPALQWREWRQHQWLLSGLHSLVVVVQALLLEIQRGHHQR